ncbi:hypothetical protein DTL42_04280 [Bremerella cremea]|uniref:HAMP domain-containing protein n=1 Tax=Bremerella cremea TaxID=1031537 RepID=A0A368KVB2_9BACT|nr:hypothetical protein [Bremerella cremea]RCS54370.1 hypothetical protein DTL42_04280 [Bremerella cremea]
MSTAVKRERRRQFWVDPQLQGSLALRIVLYYLLCWLTFGLALMTIAALSDIHAPVTAVASIMTHYYLPAVLASLVVLPLIVWDSIRYSNRLAGSVARFRQAMERLADGETASPLVVRKGDSWKSLADQFNRIAMRIEELENANQSATQQTTSSAQAEEVLEATKV